MRDILDGRGKMRILTAYVGARLELGGHLRIHGDHDLLLLGHEGVAFLHLLVDPLLEDLPDDGRADVTIHCLGTFFRSGSSGR